MTRDGDWGAMAGLIGDEVLDLFCVCGGPEALGAQLAERWGGLADQISLPFDYWMRHAADPSWRAAAEALREIA